jgi:uncharacterized linocin/CFP29 family protein
MSDSYLNRGDAPFSEKVWAKIDEAVIGAAKSQLSARRLLHIDGPYGLGLKAVPRADAPAGEKTPAAGVSLSASDAIPLALIQAGFGLAARDIAAFEQTGLAIDLGAAAAAAIACARQEDALVFKGSKALGTEGLLNARGAQAMKLRSWDKTGAAADDIIQAVTKLDDAGFHGPYTLGLAPQIYNLLLRRYPQGEGTELEHVRQIATDGVVKAPGIPSGGVLLASGTQYATIVVGQDLATAFIGPANGNYELLVVDSIALRLLEPRALCVLQ